MIDLVQLPKLAKQARPESILFFKKNKKKLTDADRLVHELHDKYSSETDCLLCANCCRTLGPRITDKDVSAMAKSLRMKPSAFYNSYLRTDEDGDMVFQSLPCPFLMSDNYCMIYENRPKACREYPHTDRKKFYQIANLSIQNAATCSVVYQVIEGLKEKLH
ncbi:MAG: YkgJ family cysteine cluster protein [Prevotellaceae bacterium]|jgi:Fe-S-cluster containining protein|nr:YkgJ family cysteine cluster protein [Prevotellaceae bacterium]